MVLFFIHRIYWFILIETHFPVSAILPTKYNGTENLIENEYFLIYC